MAKGWHRSAPAGDLGREGGAGSRGPGSSPSSAPKVVKLSKTADLV
jgi:hypothetical protein